MKIEKNAPLAPFTTFGIGGKARFFCRVKTTDELSEAVMFAKKSKLPFLILGGGSNVLISDKGFPGLVIKVEILGIEFIGRGKKVEVIAGAGESWDELVRLCVERGIGGLENLSGIRKRVTVKISQRRQHHSWSFYDLRQKVEYKAKLAGVSVVLVDPRNTSRTCPICGTINKRNRPSQSIFSCISCGFSGFADAIAAVNIGRAAVNQPDAGRDEVKTVSPEIGLRPSAPESHLL